ncbi:hypothetical protein Salat_1415800 [Sesamum alatum]|uniref:Retrovirus-related Pol polyprotein from transposon TNT 1-94-like beta-barrel domain-containing protein n=1 Tax=Sesamum alatum TaxID=300844 RepID=A0AAE1YAB7_9LAMI|nr:hypothetical protein Salat_1415800 [Sesamum alatum]
MIRGRDDQIEAIAMAVTTPGQGKGFSQSGPKQRGNTEKIASRSMGIQLGTKGNEDESNLEVEDKWGIARLMQQQQVGCDGTERLSSKVTQPIWILDIGASNHMTGRKELLSELKDTIPMSVYLSNGARTTATMVGRVVFSPKMELANVLYVPDLTCNLISIRQLISALNCQMTFINESCVIQDRTSKTPIGADLTESINGTIKAGTENDAHGEVSKLQEHLDTSNEAATQVENELVRPRRTTRLPAHLNDFVVYSAITNFLGTKVPVTNDGEVEVQKGFCKHKSPTGLY